MKSAYLLCLFFGMLVNGAPMYAQSTQPVSRPTAKQAQASVKNGKKHSIRIVAVMNHANDKHLEAMLSTLLTASGSFTVVDSDATGDSVLVPSYVLDATIVEDEATSPTRSADVPLGRAAKTTFSLRHEHSEASVQVSLRVVETLTGRIVAAADSSGRSHTDNWQIQGTPEGGSAALSLGTTLTPSVANAIRKGLTSALADVIRQMDRVPFMAIVADVQNGAVYLTCGTANNVHVGDTFNVFAVDGPLVDPSTQQILGLRKHLSGKVEVTEVDQLFAVAKIVNGTAASGNIAYEAAGASAGMLPATDTTTPHPKL